MSDTNDDGYRPPFLWPRYVEKKWASRTLAAYVSPDMLIAEDGMEYPIHSFTDFIIASFASNLLIFINEFTDFPYLEECLGRGDYVPCTERGRPIAIKMRGTRGKTRWIVAAGTWQTEEEKEEGLSVAWLKRMREFYEYAGVGTQSTPGAEGQALMRKSWQEQFEGESTEYIPGWKFHRHQRPPQVACFQIRETSVGARSDTISVNQQFETAWSIDEKNAYGAGLSRLPTGYCYHIFPGEGQTDGYETYYVRCRVTIHRELALGPFPIRLLSDFGKYVPNYPEQPGEYITWLWREEVEKAREKGCTVETYEGWGWEEWTNEFQPFVDMMSRLRDEAPNEEIANRIKKTLVAAVGRFGMPPGLNVLVPEEQAGPDDICITNRDGEALNWFVHWIPDKNPTTMPHWFFYIIMRCRLALFDQIERFAERGELISSNTDGFIVKPDADVSMYPDRGPEVKTGQWRKELIHEVIVPAPRHLESREKWVTPGIPKTKRVRRYKKRE